MNYDNTIGMESSAHLAYAMGSEHQRPIIIMLGGHGGRLEVDIEIEYTI